MVDFGHVARLLHSSQSSLISPSPHYSHDSSGVSSDSQLIIVCNTFSKLKKSVPGTLKVADSPLGQRLSNKVSSEAHNIHSTTILQREIVHSRTKQPHQPRQRQRDQTGRKAQQWNSELSFWTKEVLIGIILSNTKPKMGCWNPYCALKPWCRDRVGFLSSMT